MNFIILFLLSSLTFAARPSCGDLKTIIQSIEQQYMGSKLSDEVCRPEELKVMENPSKQQSELIKANRCSTLAAVDMQLKSIENELAMIAGLEKLKLEVITGLDKVKNPPEKQDANKAAEEFLANLDIAKHIELLLKKSTGKKKQNVLEYLTDSKVNVASALDLQKTIKDWCADKIDEKEVDLCTPDLFQLNDSIYTEVFALIEQGRKTPNVFKKSIKTLEDAFNIKHTSFTTISAELKGKLSDMKNVDRQTLKAIKELPAIVPNTGFSFIDGMLKAQQTLNKKVIGQQYRHFLQDLKDRQRWEMKSKLSLMIKDEDISKIINQKNLATVCNSAVKSLEGISDCLTPLHTAMDMNDPKRIHLGEMIAHFKVSETYLNRLVLHEEKCIPDDDLNFPVMLTCESLVTIPKQKLQDEHAALSALKTKILVGNQDLQTFRNFAFEQFEEKKCKHVESSEISSCYGALEPSAISMNAFVLAGDALDIIIVQNAKTKGTSIEKLCENNKVKFAMRDVLCKAQKDSSSSSRSSVSDEYDRQYRHSTETGDGYEKDSTASSLVDVFSKVLGFGVSSMINRPQYYPQPNYQYQPTYQPPPPTHSQQNSAYADAMCIGCYFRWTPPGGPGQSKYFDPRYQI